MAKYSDTMSKPLNFADGLLLMFIGFKLTHLIEWSWWFVLAPFWVGLIFGIIAVALGD